MTRTTHGGDVQQELADIQNRKRIALDASGLGIWEMDCRKGRIVLDDRCRHLLGYGDRSNSGIGLFNELPHPDDAEAASRLISLTQSNASDVFETTVRFKCADGIYRCFSCRREISEVDSNGLPLRALGTLSDVDAEVKSGQLLQMERDVLGRVANNKDLYESLDALATGIETVWDQVKCAINLHDPVRSTLHFGAAPSLPQVYTEVVEGFHIGDLPTVCGLAVETREFAYIPDFEHAPQEFDVSLPFYNELNVKGCWSMPVSVGDEILATCCIFTLVPRHPSDAEIIQLERLAQTTGMLIEADRQRKQKAIFETQVQTKDRLEGLGKLASGIAHDFNNLLTVVVANADLIALQEDGDTKDCAEQIRTAANVAADLCKKMLTYTGEVPFQLEAVSLGEVVTEIASMLRAGSPKCISLETNCREELPSVFGDHAMLAQLVLNLATNAVESISEHGRVTISTDVELLDEQAIADLMFSEAVHPGEYVVLRVADDGSGMDTETLRRIFDPFFSTKPDGRGLGLATVFGVVRRHRGGIAVSSTRHRGTTFTVFLPRIDAKKAEPFREPNPATAATDRRIAVIDDETALRHSIAKLLGFHGFSILSFRSGEEALGRLEDLRDCDCLLVDVKMPGMDGLETYRRIRSQLGEVPVCFMSGAASEAVGAIVHNDERCRSVSKPFASDVLVDTLRSLLRDVEECTRFSRV